MKKAKALALVAKFHTNSDADVSARAFYKWESSLEEICRSNLYVKLINPP